MRLSVQLHGLGSCTIKVLTCLPMTPMQAIEGTRLDMLVAEVCIGELLWPLLCSKRYLISDRVTISSLANKKDGVADGVRNRDGEVCS